MTSKLRKDVNIMNLHKKSVVKNDNVSMKVSWEFSLSSIPNARFSQVCLFLLKIGKMYCINVLRQTLNKLINSAIRGEL